MCADHVLCPGHGGYESVLTNLRGFAMVDLSGVLVFGGVFATLVYLFLPHRS